MSNKMEALAASFGRFGDITVKAREQMERFRQSAEMKPDDHPDLFRSFVADVYDISTVDVRSWSKHPSGDYVVHTLNGRHVVVSDEKWYAYIERRRGL